MTMKNAIKEGAKLIAVKKGIQWSGSLLKLGAIAGAGYFAYNFFKRKCGQKKE